MFEVNESVVTMGEFHSNDITSHYESELCTRLRFLLRFNSNHCIHCTYYIVVSIICYEVIIKFQTSFKMYLSVSLSKVDTFENNGLL